MTPPAEPVSVERRTAVLERGKHIAESIGACASSDGIKRDGHGLQFMPAADFAWWPDEDVVAVISYLRTVPAVARPSGEMKLGLPVGRRPLRLDVR